MLFDHMIDDKFLYVNIRFNIIYMVVSSCDNKIYIMKIL